MSVHGAAFGSVAALSELKCSLVSQDMLSMAIPTALVFLVWFFGLNHSCVKACMDAGPDAPLVLERGLTSCHMEHVYDFYKPAAFFPKVSHPYISLTHLHHTSLLDTRQDLLRSNAKAYLGVSYIHPAMMLGGLQGETIINKLCRHSPSH